MELCGVDTVLSGAVSGVCVNLTVCQEVAMQLCLVLTSRCGVNSVLAAGVFDLCGVDIMLSGVYESVWRQLGDASWCPRHVWC